MLNCSLRCLTLSPQLHRLCLGKSSQLWPLRWELKVVQVRHT